MESLSIIRDNQKIRDIIAQKALMRLLLIILTLWGSFNGLAQELVKKQSDLRLLIDQRERFINKPLKDLLKEIKPPIKYAFGTDAKDHGIPANITFKFVTHQEYLILKEVNKFPLTLIIYVKEKKLTGLTLLKKQKKQVLPGQLKT
jgi:hypothetical protein